MDKKTVGEDAKVINLNYGKNEGCRAEEEGRSSCRSYDFVTQRWNSLQS